MVGLGVGGGPQVTFTPGSSAQPSRTRKSLPRGATMGQDGVKWSFLRRQERVTDRQTDGQQPCTRMVLVLTCAGSEAGPEFEATFAIQHPGLVISPSYVGVWPHPMCAIPSTHLHQVQALWTSGGAWHASKQPLYTRNGRMASALSWLPPFLF